MDQESLHEISYQNQKNQIGQQWRKQNAPSKTNQQNLGTKFEFIAPRTPQQN